ncbi:MAG TPA: hypothetical protein VJB65_01075, partial [Patescibacteria group bacterium]|nr:hypothetical protein [Patescibacteria group bacterium]
LAKTLIPYFKAYKLNTSTYEQLISNANAALDISTTDVTTAINDRTQDSLEKATKSTTATAEAVALMVKEADTLYAQIVQ